MKASTRWILVIFILILVVVQVGKYLGNVSSKEIRNMLENDDKIKKIDIFVSDEKGSRRATIESDSALKKINQAFKFFEDFTPVAPGSQSMFIDMSVYKSKKLDFRILKTNYGGWTIAIVDNYYKNDSLISIIKLYAALK